MGPVPSESTKNKCQYYLFEDFPHSKERWQTEISDRSETSEQIPTKTKYLNDNTQKRHLGCREGGLALDLKDAYFDIPIHPTCWKLLKFPVGTERYDYGITLWNYIGPQCVYQDDGARSRICLREIGLYVSPDLEDFLGKDKEKSMIYKS